MFVIIFFFNDTATTEIYTLSLHDALPISGRGIQQRRQEEQQHDVGVDPVVRHARDIGERKADQHEQDRTGHGHRSEEHTSELQSRQYLVCRLLLEKKKKQTDEVV